MQDDLFNYPKRVHTKTVFHGSTYNAKHDGARPTSQLARVEALMSDGKWRTLAEISMSLVRKAPEASVSARLRDLDGNGWTKHRRRVEGGNGLHEYRMVKQ